MAQKKNIRSIRFSDDLAELIDQQVGRTFTEKIKNLITRCVWELPQKETELKRLQAQVEAERQRLRELEQKRQELQRTISSLDRALDQCLYSASEAIKRLNML